MIRLGRCYSNVLVDLVPTRSAGQVRGALRALSDNSLAG
jgi:hypothetical protein